jgi:hypothetical protein
MKLRLAIMSAAVLWAGTSAANTKVNLGGIAFRPDTASCGSYDNTSVTNTCGSSETFRASLPFLPPATSNMTLYVDGYLPAGGSMTCYAYSYNYNGTYLGNASFSNSTAGWYSKPLTLTSAILSTWAYVSVICNIPYGGIIQGATQTF